MLNSRYLNTSYLCDAAHATTESRALWSSATARQRRQGTKWKDMNDRGHTTLFQPV